MNAPAKRRPKRIVEVENYLRDLAPLIILADWTITVDQSAVGTSNDAEVTTINGHHAVVSFADSFWDLSPEEQRQVCTHELGHLPCHGFYSLRDQVSAIASETTAAPVIKFSEDLEEHITEYMARNIAPHLPLPPTFTKPRRRGAR